MTEQLKYSIGDPVWSKMKGYCPWPSRIAAPSESNLKNQAKTPKVHYLVYFFGSNNFAWMPEDTVKPYAEFKDKNKNGAKSQQFKQGLKQIEEYIAQGGKESLLELVNSAAIKNDDDATSPSAAGDSLSNDAHLADGDLPSIDDELAVIKKTSANNSASTSKKSKHPNDSQNDSASLKSPVPSSVQKDYSRTPFKSRKAAAKSDDLSTDITSPTKRLKTSEDDSYGATSLSSTTISSSSANTTSKPPPSKSGARSAIMRATNYDMPIIETPQVNLSSISAKTRQVRPSNLKIGFIGLGFMGQRLLKNLLNSGHNLTIYNRSSSKCKEFVEAGATAAQTPSDVVSATDIIFISLPNTAASKNVVFGNFGLLSGDLSSSKGIIEMSSLNPETSNDISEAIISKGGRYLEAPTVLNGKQAAEDGELTIIAAGDKSLYEDALPCFQAMGKKTFFLSHQPSFATRMNLIVSMLYGSILGALTECNHMIESCKDLQLSDFRDILDISTMNCPLVINTLERLISIKSKSNPGDITVPLGHIQKDLKHALEVADSCDQSIPITAIANELFKTAKLSGFAEHDTTSLVKARF